MVCAFCGFEDIDEFADQVPQAGYGSLFGLSQHGLSLEKAFSIGLKSGLYGSRNRNAAPAASIRSRTVARLWLDRLSMPMAAGHVGGRPGLVNEHEACGVQIDLAVEPVAPLLQDVRAVLLDCMSSLFCASCRDARKIGEVRLQRRSDQSRPGPRVALQA